MLSFRQFEVGPDPFGRTWQARLKWLQNAISVRHSDSVDAKFILATEDGTRVEKLVALMHPYLLELCRKTGHELNDPWTGRLAAEHLKHMIETGEDMEKDIITPNPAELEQYAGTIDREEKEEVRRRGAA